jgi:hypothetical protein
MPSAFQRCQLLKLEYSSKVTNALMKAFPRFSPQKAHDKLIEYTKMLERLMRRAKITRKKLRNKSKIYEFEGTNLWDKSSWVGTIKPKRLHQWLTDNRVPLVINTNTRRNTKELAKFRTTSLLTVKNESLLDLLRSMSPTEIAYFLDNPSIDDIDEINDYLKEFRSLSVAEQSEQYDMVQVDIESLKNYIKKLGNRQVFIEYFKQESDADNAEYILRIAQLNNGQLPQLKFKSDFGRNYYKNWSVLNVSKRVREAFLGDSWEYDCKSCSASWKMAFAHEWHDSKKRPSKSFEDSVCGLSLYLEYKSEFFDEVIDCTYLAEFPYSHEHKVRVIKEAMTAIGFGAKLTMGSWKASDGEIKSSSLLQVFDENTTLLRRFIDCTIVREYNDEQSNLNKFIVDKFSTDSVWLAELEESRKSRNRKPYKLNQKISWLFQHAETLMMDLVRDELKKLGKTVLANIHDAIVVRERLTKSELLAIESFVRTSTNVQYFALGETEYKRTN